MLLQNSTLHQLLSFRPEFSAVLYEYGIKFYEFEESTSLKAACAKAGFPVEKVIQDLESNSGIHKLHSLASVFDDYPIKVVIGYLKHMHHLFLHRRIPYFLELVSRLDTSDHKLPSWADDLKMAFPLFAEDFIHHIHREEDGLFKKIDELRSFLQTGHYHGSQENTKRIVEMAKHHEDDDDEMQAIRGLTQNYHIKLSMPLHLRVILSNLHTFDHELQVHAKVENEVLFPKAIQLEQEADKRLSFLSSLN